MRREVLSVGRVRNWRIQPGAVAVVVHGGAGAVACCRRYDGGRRGGSAVAAGARLLALVGGQSEWLGAVLWVDDAVLLAGSVTRGLGRLETEGGVDADRWLTGKVVGASAGLPDGGTVTPDYDVSSQRVTGAVCNIRLGTGEDTSCLVICDLSRGQGRGGEDNGSSGLHCADRSTDTTV